MFTDASASVPASAVLDPPAATTPPAATGPRTEQGKAASARNATTHGLFARDVVLPALGEDPHGYRLLEDAWLAQLPPRTLLEQHYVEKIAAASWRLRRLHRWQAQLFEDETLTEEARLDRLDKALRHETHLHRQIDTAVRMLGRDAPALYARRIRDEVLEEAMTSERECRDSARDETEIDLETRGRLRRIRKATEAVVTALTGSLGDTQAAPRPVPPRPVVPSISATPWRSAEPAPPAPAEDDAENCRNEPPFRAEETKDEMEEANGDLGGAAQPQRDGSRETATTKNRENEPGSRTEDRRAFLSHFPSTPAPAFSAPLLHPHPPLTGEGRSGAVAPRSRRGEVQICRGEVTARSAP